jgi:ubiquinone/menaquinone biosynthesis C-methylase UbiE
MKKTNYSKIAATYDQSEARHYIRKDENIEILLKKFDSIRVLDLGCGTGNYLARQQDLFGTEKVEWYGVEPSEGMLNVAKSKVENVDFRLGSAEELPHENTFFHYVICNHSYHHFLDKERGFSQVHRVLVPNGLFFINSIYPFEMIDSWIYSFFENSYEEDCKRFLPEDALTKILVSLGFTPRIDLDKRIDTLLTAKLINEAMKRNYSQLDIIDEESYAKGLYVMRKFFSEGYTEMESEYCKMYVLSEK